MYILRPSLDQTIARSRTVANPAIAKGREKSRIVALSLKYRGDDRINGGAHVWLRFGRMMILNLVA
jgi:hypothetical protein